MNYSGLSSELGMYTNHGYMLPPPPPYAGGGQHYQPGLYSHQPPTEQQFSQQQQQQHKHYQMESFLHNPSSANESAAYTPGQVHGHASHTPVYQNGVSQVQSQRQMPPLSPAGTSLPQPPISSLQSRMVPHHRAAASPNMHGSTPAQHGPPPLSPVHRVTPQTAPISPGHQHYPHMVPSASEAQAATVGQSLPTSGDFCGQQSLSAHSPGQVSHTWHYTQIRRPSLEGSTNILPGPPSHAPQPGTFSTQQHLSNPEASPVGHAGSSSRPVSYSPADGHRAHWLRHPAGVPNTTASAPHALHNSFSNTYQTSQNRDRFGPQQRNGGGICSGQAEVHLANNSTWIPPVLSEQPVSGASVVNYSTAFPASRPHLPSGSRPAAATNIVNYAEQGNDFLAQGAHVQHFTGVANFQNTNSVQHGRPPVVNLSCRGSKRGRGRGSARGKGRGAAVVSASLERRPEPPTPSSVPSFQSDIEAMQAGVVVDMIASDQSRLRELPKSQTSVMHTRAAQSHSATSKSNPPLTCKEGPNHERPVSASSASHSSLNTRQVISSSSRAAALEAISVKQEIMENMAKFKRSQSDPQQGMADKAKPSSSVCQSSVIHNNSTTETLVQAAKRSSSSQMFASGDKQTTNSCPSNIQGQQARSVSSQSSNPQKSGQQSLTTAAMESDVYKNNNRGLIASLLNAPDSDKKIQKKILVGRENSGSDSNTSATSRNNISTLSSANIKSRTSSNGIDILTSSSNSNSRTSSSDVNSLTRRSSNPDTQTGRSKNVDTPTRNSNMNATTSSSNKPVHRKANTVGQTKATSQTRCPGSVTASKFSVNNNSGRRDHAQRRESAGIKPNWKAIHAHIPGKNPLGPRAVNATIASSVPLENERPMTAKERVINMWRDGQVVGRNPNPLKRPLKKVDASQPLFRTRERGNNFQSATSSSENGVTQENKKVARVSDFKTSKEFLPSGDAAKPSSSKVTVDLCYILFHGHKLICLKSPKEKALLLRQFQFECFPDKGMGSVNNCIDRSLRIKKKVLQHRRKEEIVAYLRKNDYKIDSEVLTINLEDGRRVYHHMYGIRNCVSASCVVEVLDQPVELSQVVTGTKNRTFTREMLGLIKKEKNTSGDDSDGLSSKPQSTRQGEDVTTGVDGKDMDKVIDDDARSDHTMVYGANEKAEDDDLVIVSVEYNNLIFYSGEGPMVGMLCDSLMGSVRSYRHENEHYLVVEDLCKMFGSSEFNASIDNANITVFSCCPKIGAFLNQISDKFPPISSFHECLVREKDLGVQWASDAPESSSSTITSSKRPCLKQEISDEQLACSVPKQQKLMEETSTSQKVMNFLEGDLDSPEPSLQIDMNESQESSKKVTVESESCRTVASVTAVAEAASCQGATASKCAAECAPPISSSPESHISAASAETAASALVLEETPRGGEVASRDKVSTDASCSLSSATLAPAVKRQDQEPVEVIDADAVLSEPTTPNPTAVLADSHPAPQCGNNVHSRSWQGTREEKASHTPHTAERSHSHRPSKEPDSSSSLLHTATRPPNLPSSSSFAHPCAPKNAVMSLTVDDIDVMTTDNSNPMGPSFENGNKAKRYWVNAVSQLRRQNTALIGIVHKLRSELSLTKTARDKAEKVSKHLEDALATMTSSFPFGNSSDPIVIDVDEKDQTFEENG